MHRFFVSPEAIHNGIVTLGGEQARQVISVLRMEPGSVFQVFDNSGWQYETEVVSARGEAVTARVKSKTLVDSEPRTKVTIYQGVLKAAKFELVLQKCTELGASAFVPVITERTVIGDVSPNKVERWKRIIVEAAEQSGRGKLPALRAAMMLDQAYDQARGLSLLAWEGERTVTIRGVLQGLARPRGALAGENRQRPFSVNLFLGPEGGFSAGEVGLARSYGIMLVSLGQRILRAETAAITATGLVLYEMGDLGG
ncbi:MAG TPA: RsmE family RNA methyltransferase [Chloroflexota bacterium]|nr:RsmE family RNA methyltransferase [Chloroflexota bacterium]